MMKSKQVGWRIDRNLAQEFMTFCAERGWNQNRQVEIALREWLESHATRKSARRGRGGLR